MAAAGWRGGGPGGREWSGGGARWTQPGRTAALDSPERPSRRCAPDARAPLALAQLRRTSVPTGPGFTSQLEPAPDRTSV